MSLPTMRQALLALAVIFVIYAVINSPAQSGTITRDAWAHLTHALSAIGVFFNTLLNQN